MKKVLKIEIAVCVAIGVLVGIGYYTFDYAKGLSYMSNDPKACMNCHVMADHYDSWIKSSHRKAATCNDCHIPHEFPRKYLVKAENGWNHSKAFTLQNFKEPIRIRKSNLRELQNNCIHCHDNMVSGIVGHGWAKDGKNLPRCTTCHRSVGHMSLD